MTISTDIVSIAAGDNNIGNVDIASIAAGNNNIGDVDVASIAAGDNNIGNVDIVTVPADPFGLNADAAATAGSTGTIQAKLRLMTSQLDSIKTAVEIIDNSISGSETQVDVVTQPARVRTTDAIAVALQTDAVMNGATALTPKFAVIDAATSGDNTIVGVVASKKIRVLSLFYVSSGSVTTRFESNAGGTALTGQMTHAASTGMALPFNPVGWFETAAGELLNLELSGAVSVDGALTYIEV